MADEIHHKFLKVPHRYVVFTIPDTLRRVFENPEGASQHISFKYPIIRGIW
jgi:hypothetical protein